ncbi:ABC transporter ATP-binding protein [Aquimarina gracilis]
MVLGTIANLASPYFLKIIIDDIIPSKDVKSLFYIIGLMLIVYLLRVIVGFVSDYLSTFLGNKIVNDIKLDIFQNLINRDINYFEKNKSGDIIQKINMETHKVQSFITHSIIRFISNIITITCLIAMLWVLNFKLFLISILVIPFSILINRFYSKKLQKTIKKASAKEGDLYTFFIGVIKNIKLIKVFNAQKKELNNADIELKELLRLYIKSTVYSSISRNGATFFVAMGSLIVLSYGGYQVISELMTVGALVAFIQYLNRIYSPANDLIFLYVDCIKAQVSMERIFPLLSKDTSESFKENNYTKINTIESISIDEVDFNHNETLVLKRVKLDFSRGKKYAIVGPSGSGKSTLINLLCKFYEPKKGKIILNKNLCLSKVNPISWIEKVTLVQQEPLIFEKSIRDNLLYGDFNASDEDLWEALSVAQLSDYILSTPNKLDTRIGDGQDSILLSGGQQQQLSIARALLKNSSVLILDEATSALDSVKEKTVLSSIFDNSQNKIIILISHKLSSVIDVDHIFYLEEGKVKEEGTHFSLLAKEKSYFKLFQNQLFTKKKEIVAHQNK